MSYPDSIRMQAYALYVSKGLSPEKIAIALSLNRKSTIYEWIKKEEWKEARDKHRELTRSKAIANSSDKAAKEVTKFNNRALKTLSEIQKQLDRLLKELPKARHGTDIKELLEVLKDKGLDLTILNFESERPQSIQEILDKIKALKYASDVAGNIRKIGFRAVGVLDDPKTDPSSEGNQDEDKGYSSYEDLLDDIDEAD